jgi:hypothetical protein
MPAKRLQKPRQRPDGLDQTIKTTNSIRTNRQLLTETYRDTVRRIYDHVLQSSERVRLDLIVIHPSKGNTLYSTKQTFDIFPSFFGILPLELFQQILNYLDLYDLRFLAMSSKSFYRNFYNPKGSIFDLLVQKCRIEYPLIASNVDNVAQGFCKRKRMLLSLSLIGDFRYLSFIAQLDIMGQYVVLYMPDTKDSRYQYISCFVEKRFRFSNIMVIPHHHITQEELIELYQSPSSIRFKTIRHWLSRCLDCELYQLDMEQLAHRVCIYLNHVTKFPLHLNK